MNKIDTRIPHKIPKDLGTLLRSNTEVLDKWKRLTPLAQNEWICWITIAKESRNKKRTLGALARRFINGREKTVLLAWMSTPK